MSEAFGRSHHVAQMALDLEAETSTQDTLDVAVRLAVEAIDGCDAASVSIVHRGKKLETPASSAVEATRADELQYEHGEGPCVSAIFDEEIVSSPDLTTEARWPAWAAAAAEETAVRSMLCFRLFTHARTVGSLNLYASRPHSFTGDDLDLGVVFATHVAIATAGAERRKNAKLAMDSRTLIGQAQGIVMERFGVEAVPAFALIKRLSQNGNRKLYDVALEIVMERNLPDQE